MTLIHNLKVLTNFLGGGSAAKGFAGQLLDGLDILHKGVMRF